MLLVMDWMYIHRTKVNCYENDVECLDDNGENRILQGKKKTTSVGMVTTMQEISSHRKGCVFYVVHNFHDKGKED